MTNYPENLDLAFHALSDRTRRAVVMRLSRGPASVSELHEPLAMAMPTLLQHIRVLENSGLVDTEKTGRVRTCTVRPEILGATEAWLARQRAIWAGRLDRMEAYAISLHAEEKPAEEKKDGEPKRK